MTLAIEIKQLSKSFGSLSVLDGDNINVPQGSVYGFLGNNGARKSTLIRIILGLLHSDNGWRYRLSLPSNSIILSIVLLLVANFWLGRREESC